MGFFPFFSVETWILLATFVCLFVMYGYSSHRVLKKLGIPGPKPLMYLGTVGRHHKVYYQDDYECFKKYGRLWGVYELRKPMIAVMEPDMLKAILVKECFTYFTNRRDLYLNGDLYDAVSITQDDQWRRIRNILTPGFTSGRNKEMYSIMKHHSSKMKNIVGSKVNQVVDIKSIFGPYSLDVMAGCLFSVDMDTVNNPSSPLLTHASKMFRISLSLFMLQGCFPFLLPLLKWLGYSFFSTTTIAYFHALLKKIREERDGSSGQFSGDLLQLMENTQRNSASNSGKRTEGLTDHEIISQITMFFIAGFDTSAITLTFLAYNLAQNPEVMSRLQKEIDATFPNQGPIEYEALMQMEYLDSVIQESLRLYPPAARLERVAKETVKINGITIPKDTIVYAPIYALHRDPELWPEPEEFRPERFSKENKKNINPYTYLPFGIGPRNCIGMRFALQMVKLALVEYLQSYSFSVCEETEIPLQMDPEGLLGPLRPIKLRVESR